MFATDVLDAVRNMKVNEHVATLRPAAVGRGCKFVGSKAASSTKAPNKASPSSL